uniref:Uncharacterized protein n=1 Tax=Arundo donax TaxID=35708 RepID=A0A0A9HE23_ARUDO
MSDAGIGGTPGNRRSAFPMSLKLAPPSWPVAK